MAWFNISVAAYDTGRGTAVIEADSWEEAFEKFKRDKVWQDVSLENDGEYGPFRIVDAIQVENEDDDPRGGVVVAEDIEDFCGDGEMFLAHTDFQKKAFALVNKLATPRLQRNAIIMLEAMTGAEERPETRRDLAYDLLDKVKYNPDFEVIIGTLKGVLEAQAIREKIKQDFFSGKKRNGV